MERRHPCPHCTTQNNFPGFALRRQKRPRSSQLMTVSRRDFLGIAIAGTALATDAFGKPMRTSSPATALIDRKALVTRHNPVLDKFDPLSPLSIGNGEFAFTAEATGLQTFTAEYEKAMPLCTMSQWGWHTTPLPAGLNPNAL